MRKAFAIILMLALPAVASAEPYLAVFKGMHCSSCHSSAAGGGLRTAYGNVFAQSELAAAPSEPDQNGYWTGAVTEWLSAGADLRAEYRSVDTPNSDSSNQFDIARAAVYVEGHLIPRRLSIYIDQQFAPGSSLNREAYLKLKNRDGRFYLAAGQFFLPYGLRLQDDTAFVRQVTGVNFFSSDRGIQVGFESGSWSSQLSVTNGSGGGAETDDGKQISFVGSFVKQNWRIGLSLNSNNSALGDRQMANVFVGWKTGTIVWLAEIDLIEDELPAGGDQNAIAGFVEANWLYRNGHNLKIGYDYFDPDDAISEDHQVRWNVVWEYTPMQFVQARFGARLHDGVPQVDAQNRDEIFAELHAFF